LLATDQSNMNRKWLKWALIALVPILGYGAYLAHTEWQTRLGQQALDATHLDFLPLDQALARAKAEGKPVLADFSAIWCPTCRAMHANVFTNAAVKTAITKDFILSRVDYESVEAPTFMDKYGVRGFPTLLVLDGDGKLLRQVPVSLDPASFLTGLGG
jgi:thiol:disulfide interchange protein